MGTQACGPQAHLIEISEKRGSRNSSHNGTFGPHKQPEGSPMWVKVSSSTGFKAGTSKARDCPGAQCFLSLAQERLRSRCSSRPIRLIKYSCDGLAGTWPSGMAPHVADT